MTDHLLISIKPEFALKIIAGTKTVELRRKFPIEKAIGKIAVIYASTPLKKIIGYVTIENVSLLAVDVIWNQYGEASNVEKDFFDRYYANISHGFVVHLTRAFPLKKQITLQQLKEHYNISPPQSYRYLSEEVLQAILS